MTEVSWLYQKPHKFHPGMTILFQKELYQLLCNLVGDPTNNKNTNKLVAEKDFSLVQKYCPKLLNYLKILNLENTTIVPCFLISQNVTNKIHIDYPSNGVALNVPILNCNDTYTVWYDAKDRIETASAYATDSWNEPAKSPMFDESTAVELDRIDSNVPHWVNIAVPHAAVCNHNKVRINASIRFSDTILNYLKKAYSC
jgi:hypothetical protein